MAVSGVAVLTNPNIGPFASVFAAHGMLGKGETVILGFFQILSFFKQNATPVPRCIQSLANLHSGTALLAASYSDRLGCIGGRVGPSS